MEQGKNEWIDPALARRLMLDYRQALGVKGGSEIERQIEAHTKLGLHRKTIENWLNDPDSVPSPQTLKIIQRFLNTPHAHQVLPHARDYLGTDARLFRIGTMLFDLYGVKGEDITMSIAKNAYLAGWWVAQPFFRGNSTAPSFLHIVPVAGRPFSKIQVSVQSDQLFPGAGITFPTTAGSLLDFSVRIWSQEGRHQEKILKLYCLPGKEPVNEEKLGLLFERTEHPTYSSLPTQKVMFTRANALAIPGSVRDLFDRWDRTILPSRRSEWGLIS